MTMTPPARLTNIALTSELTRLAGREREATAALIVHLAEGASGTATVENIPLRCRAHNGYEAERFYGPGVRRTRVEQGASQRTRGGAAPCGPLP